MANLETDKVLRSKETYAAKCVRGPGSAAEQAEEINRVPLRVCEGNVSIFSCWSERSKGLCCVCNYEFSRVCMSVSY